MIEQNAVKPLRKVAVADHLWEAYEQMARDMGSDRDGLINQAMYMFARLNGFMLGGASGTAPARPAAQRPSVREVPPPKAEEERLSPEEPEERRGSPPKLYPGAEREPPAKAPMPSDDDPRRREVAERVLETAAELERLIKGKSAAAVDAPARAPASIDDLPPARAGEKQLYLMAEDGELDKVIKDRFLIGRGKHCDFIINSGKVSREHAVIVRDGQDYFVEDLGSSNGTWFNKQRIKRRKIEDGDEYFICSEKIKCVVR
jgi:hypothetical protein